MLEYHAALIADEVRTNAFLDALKKTIRPGTRVLEVGAGTGVLSVAAAKIGADVVAIERSEMIECARRVARSNNCEIEFIEKDIFDIAVDEIKPVDIVVSEMIGNALFDEMLIPVMASARRFLKPGGVMIPRKVSWYAAPVYSDLVAQALQFWRTPHYGIDFSPLANLMEHYRFDDRLKPSTLLGPPVLLDEIDLKIAEGDRMEARATLSTSKEGICNAALVWWEADLGEGVRLEQRPDKVWPNQH